MKRHNLRLLSLVGAAAVLCAAGRAHATPYYWDANGATSGFGTASGTWDAAPSGSAFFSTSSVGTAATSTATTTTGDALSFGSATNGLSAGTVTVSGTQNINNLTSAATSGSITLSGGTINLGGASPSLTDNHTDAAATAFTIGSQLTGSSGLTKFGSGRVVLSGANSYSGATVVDAGVLQANSNTAFGNTSGISLTARAVGTGTAAGTALQLSGGVNINKSLTLNSNSAGTLRSALVSLSGDNEWSGAVTLQGNGFTRFNLFNNAVGNLKVSGNVTGASYTGTFLLGGNSTSNEITGTITLNSGATLQKADPGTWTISSTGNSWGVTFLSQDTLILGADHALAVAAPFEQGAGSGNSTLKLNGFNQIVAGLGDRTGGLTGTRRIVNGSAALSTFTVDQAGNYAYSGILGGPGANENNLALVKSGAGTLTLSGANTYTGGTTIKNGVLAMAGGNGRLPTADVVLGDSVTHTSGKLMLSDGTTARNQTLTGLTTAGTGTANRVVGGAAGTSVLTLDIAGTNTFGGLLGGPGGNENNLALTKSGAGTLTLSGTNTYTGATTLSAGALRIQNASALGSSAAGTTIQASGSLQIDGSFSIAESFTTTGSGNGAADDITGPGAIRNLSGNSTLTGDIALTSGAGGTTIKVDAGSLTLNGAVSNTSTARSLYLGGAATGVVNGVISDGSAAVSLMKFDGGAWTLNEANTYTGATTLRAGTLSVSDVADNGSASNLGQGSSLIFQGGTLAFTAAAADSTNRAVSINSSGATFNVTNAAGKLTLTGALSGAGGLAKSGAGTLELTNSNTYANGTTVSAGTLLANNTSGSATGSGSVVVNGGVFGGTGVVSGAITVNSTGTLAPGASIQSLSGGALTFNNNSTFAYEIDSAASLSLAGDLQVADGGLNLNGLVKLALADLTPSNSWQLPISTTLTLINYSGAWNGGLFTIGGDLLNDGDTFAAGKYFWQIDYDALADGSNFASEQIYANHVNITLMGLTIPEPSTWCLALCGVSLLAWRLRKTRKLCA